MPLSSEPIYNKVPPLVGLQYEDAVKIAIGLGFQVRALSIDGNIIPTDRSFVHNRVNMDIVNDIVVEYRFH